MGKLHFSPEELQQYRARIEALFASPVVRALFAEAERAAAADEADLAELGVEVPPGDPITLGEMLLADSRNPDGMTRPEMVSALKGWARLKMAELRIQAKANGQPAPAPARPIQWSAVMTLAACGKRFGAPNRRKVREHLDRIGVAWESVGKRHIRVDTNTLPAK